jgi:quercetin dioxygenase-like cupin family protein
VLVDEAPRVAVVGDKDGAPLVTMAGEDVAGVGKRVLVSPAEGWEGWVMRLFEVEPGGHTPRHSHPWPHINYVPAGKGSLFVGGEERPLTAGSYAYVPAGAEHQFGAAPDEPLSFICIVPAEGDY